MTDELPTRQELEEKLKGYNSISRKFLYGFIGGLATSIFSAIGVIITIPEAPEVVKNYPDVERTARVLHDQSVRIRAFVEDLSELPYQPYLQPETEKETEKEFNPLEKSALSFKDELDNAIEKVNQKRNYIKESDQFKDYEYEKEEGMNKFYRFIVLLGLSTFICSAIGKNVYYSKETSTKRKLMKGEYRDTKQPRATEG